MLIILASLIAGLYAINVRAPTSTTGTQLISYPNTSTLYATYDQAAGTITYNANVIKGTYIAIGYGA